jgi:hypothetical protein
MENLPETLMMNISKEDFLNLISHFFAGMFFSVFIAVVLGHIAIQCLKDIADGITKIIEIIKKKLIVYKETEK